MVAHTFNPSTQEGRNKPIPEFKASLVYGVSSRTVFRDTQSPKTEEENKKKRKNILSEKCILLGSTSCL